MDHRLTAKAESCYPLGDRQVLDLLVKLRRSDKLLLLNSPGGCQSLILIARSMG